MGELIPGGTIAVQMPDNLDEPSHASMRELAEDPRFSHYFPNGGVRRAALPACGGDAEGEEGGGGQSKSFADEAATKSVDAFDPTGQPRSWAEVPL